VTSHGRECEDKTALQVLYSKFTKASSTRRSWDFGAVLDGGVHPGPGDGTGFSGRVVMVRAEVPCSCDLEQFHPGDGLSRCVTRE